jgi:effector-binding domain-containing protein/ribosome-associated toxin RatA of RatAB toxin-antitoxin module
MKVFKYLLFLLLIIFIGSSVFIAVQPNSFEVTRSRTINAPAAVIFNTINDFKNWESWSAWKEKNPDTKITYSKQTSGVGGSYSWEDDDGIGSMTTIATSPFDSIHQQMQFGEFPVSNVNWRFKPTDDGQTQVTWKISGEKIPFMLKFYSAISGGFDKMMGPDFERGLEKLDSIVVSSMKIYAIKINGVTEYGGGFYLYKTTNASNSNISAIMGQQFGSISAFMSQNNIPFNGMPFTIYNEMNFENNTVIMSNAIPVKEKIIITGDSNVLCGYMPKVTVLKATLKGNYTHLGEAWRTALKYITDNNLERSDQHPFEIYTTDPGDFPNPADWITEIYIAIKD